METKNIIIVNYGNALSNIVTNFISAAGMLNNNEEENLSTIKTLNIILESLRSQTVIVQQELDKYSN